MTDEQKTNRAEPGVPFTGGPFAAIMEKMMGRQGNGCDCAKMMSQMMAKCGGAQDDKEETATEAPRKA